MNSQWSISSTSSPYLSFKQSLWHCIRRSSKQSLKSDFALKKDYYFNVGVPQFDVNLILLLLIIIYFCDDEIILV